MNATHSALVFNIHLPTFNSTMKTIIRDIFEACTLHRENYKSPPFAVTTYAASEIVNISDLKKFDDAIAKLLVINECKYLSQEMLLIIIRRTLVECGTFCDFNINVRIEKFSENLKGLKLVDYKVIKTFYGATIRQSNGPVKFGPLVVYELPRHADKIIPLFRPKEYTIFQRQEPEKTVIECLVKAKDEIKALELANNAFNAFDQLIAFLLGEKYTEYSIGILRMHFAPHQNAIISCDGGVFSGEEENNSFKGALDISDLSRFLANDGEGALLDQLLDIVISPASDLEKKISKTVEWVGESYSDINRSSAYLKAVIALEALLKMDEKSIITPSIMSSIAEQCAYLNGQSTEECLNIEKKVKTLYSERSKIAHTGSTSVSIKTLREARAFVRQTILNFIHFAKKFDIKSTDDFQSTLRKRKYQCGGLG
jgi:hypothetical protein